MLQKPMSKKIIVECHSEISEIPYKKNLVYDSHGYFCLEIFIDWIMEKRYIL